MEKIKYFFDCYFNQSYHFEDLDNLIEEFKQVENENYKSEFINQLYQVIKSRSYRLISKIIKKFGGRTLNSLETEELLKYIYDKLLDRPAYLDIKKYVKDCKVVFCPVCCPDSEKVKRINLIEKAKIIGKDLQIYICKPCKLVWLTEDIRADNSQDYKKLMKKLGLKGLWKELEEVDIL